MLHGKKGRIGQRETEKERKKKIEDTQKGRKKSRKNVVRETQRKKKYKTADFFCLLS